MAVAGSTEIETAVGAVAQELLLTTIVVEPVAPLLAVKVTVSVPELFAAQDTSPDELTLAPPIPLTDHTPESPEGFAVVAVICSVRVQLNPEDRVITDGVIVTVVGVTPGTITVTLRTTELFSMAVAVITAVPGETAVMRAETKS